MIPVIIQKRGAVHLADEDESAAANILLESPSVVPLPEPPRAVLELVPESVARENIVLPVRLDGDTLYVAAADPNDLLVADKLTFILNKKVKLVRYPRAPLQAAINRHYGRTKTEPVDSMLREFTDTASDFTSSAAERSTACVRRTKEASTDWARD